MADPVYLKTMKDTSIERVEICHETKDVPACGFGVGANFKAHNQLQELSEIGAADFWWENSLASSLASGFSASVVINGVLAEIARTRGNQIGILTNAGWVWHDLPQQVEDKVFWRRATS